MPPFPSSDRVRRWPVRTFVKENNVELYTPSKEDTEAVYGETNDRPLIGDFVTARSRLALERTCPAGPKRPAGAHRPDKSLRIERPDMSNRTGRIVQRTGSGRPGGGRDHKA